MPEAELNGTTLYYEEHGSGEPLLLIEGFATHSLIWALQVPELAQHYRVITFDNRGMGRSAVPPGPYTTRQMADDAVAVLDRLGIERAHVAGWSMGGMIAQELALAHPRRVDRLVLFASLARGKDFLGGGREQGNPWLNFIVQTFEKELDPAGQALNLMPWNLTAAFMSQPDLVEVALEQALADPFPPSPEAIAAQAEACLSHLYGDAIDRLHGISAPTLVLVGAEDILTPVVYARELAERIPGARLQILERGGHSLHLQYPQDFNAAVLGFLAERPPEAMAGA